MPYVDIKITKEGGPEGTGPTVGQKAELIKGITDLLVTVLDKNPSTTFVVINEVELYDWGIGGLSVTEYRKKYSG